MSPMTAQSIAEVAAAIDVVFTHASDFERMSAWQPDLKVLDVLRRDGDGRPVRVYTELDTPLRLAKATLEIRYTVPSFVGWTMVEGNVPAFEGSWKLARLAATLTRVEYEVVIDFGKLGRLVRGPAAGLMRDQAVSSMPSRLKAHVENLHSSPSEPHAVA